MGSIVGFTCFLELPPSAAQRALAAEQRALAHFKHLEYLELIVGPATVRVWGHRSVTDRIHRLADGSTFVLIGSPHNAVDWQATEQSYLKSQNPADFTIPWEGRVVLLHLSPDGKTWRLWNDWLGTITTYRAELPQNGRLLTTLEPVCVAATGSTSEAFFLPGLVSLLLNGYLTADWTLYNNIKTLPPDSLIVWDEHGPRSQALWTVQPTQDRWEASWDELVDEMHELTYRAIATSARNQPVWALPLSSGLDSRLIAAVLADLGVEVRAYAWGNTENTDAIYSKKIARTLGFPWKHIDLPDDFLLKYTSLWADWFGSSMHFHGMYLMSFLDEIQAEPFAPTMNGFIGDVITGDGLNSAMQIHAMPRYQLGSEWYVHWRPETLQPVAKFPLAEALEANKTIIQEQIAALPGARYQKFLFMPLRNRQRLFISFLSTLMDYWRGTATPYLDRAYARFCFSLPRNVFDDRRLLGDVFRRYYGKLAVIPGSYADDPYILTGRYLVQRRAAQILPPALRHRLTKGFDNLHVDINFASIHAHGRQAFWPLPEAWDKLSEWLDLSQTEEDLKAVLQSEDVKSLRRLQVLQMLAYRLQTA